MSFAGILAEGLVVEAGAVTIRAVSHLTEKPKKRRAKRR